MLEGNIMVMSILMMLIYVICSALGLILLKMGLSNKAIISFVSSFIEMRIPMLLLIGALLYIFSFLLNMLVISRFNLNYIYPISAGLIYILISILSVLLLKESINNTQIIGMGAILVGIIIMNIGK